MPEPTYRTAVACAVAGVDASTLRTRKARGYSPVEARGQGWTEFTFTDLVALYVMEDLIRRYRMEPARASRVGKIAASQAWGHEKQKTGTHRAYVAIGNPGSAEELYVPFDNLRDVVGRLFQVFAHSSLILIDVVKVVEQVKGKLRELGEEVEA